MLSRIARQIACNPSVYKALCLANRYPRIVMFHGIGSAPQEISVFRSQLEFLNRYFRVVPIDQFADCVRVNKSGPPRVVLTFDDGLRNNLLNAYPILKASNTPATFFVCPGLVGTGRWLWNHEVTARLNRLPLDTRVRLARRIGLGTADIYSTTSRMKRTIFGERIKLEHAIRELTPRFVPTSFERDAYDLMDWTELKSLDPKLITIGGHSMHHEILPQLSPEHLEYEIAECRARLESELQRRVRHFCYPNGAYNNNVRNCVGRHFETAVTTVEDWVSPNASPLELPRIPIAANWQDLAWRMQRPTG